MPKRKRTACSVESSEMLEKYYELFQQRGEESFRGQFGLPSYAVERLYLRMVKLWPSRPKFWGKSDLLLGLNFLAEPAGNWAAHAARWRVHPDTFQKRLGTTLAAIDNCLPKLRFEDRWENWSYKQPSFIIDTFKCPISEPTMNGWQYIQGTDKWWYKYEVAVAIGSPRIVWLAGPFKGAASDSSIADVSGIKNAMVPGERALADKIYRHSKETFICPISGDKGKLPKEEKAYNFLIYSARQTVERGIKRMRNGKFSKHTWRYGPHLHKLCMMCQAKLTNWCFLFEPLG